MSGSVTHPLDAGRNRLRKLVDGATEAAPRLPLVHSTDSFSFEDALSSGEITPQDCPVFTGESLTYFFYGRPSFRPNADADPTGLQHYFPVCLIFKPDFKLVVSRAFPFDSGAFQHKLYEAYIHKRMKLGDFGLEPNLSTPGKVVTQFFHSVPSYLLGKPKNDPSLDPSDFEALSISALIQSKGANTLDGRSASVEVQTNQSIMIKDAVAAVALPSTFADGITGRKLKKLRIDILPYRTFERSKPDDYTTTISNLCLDYYIRMRLIRRTDI